MEKELFKNLQKVFSDFGPLLINEYKKNLTSSGHISSGKLRDSLSFEVSWSGGLLELSLSLEDYWKYLENGTRPHFPPPQKILEWIKAKPIVPRPLKNGKLPSQEQLAYLIGRKISQEGTKGTNDLEMAEDNLWSRFESSIDTALSQDLEEDTDEILTLLWK